MFKKIVTLMVLAAFLCVASGAVYASEGQCEKNCDKSMTRGAASLLLPGWGQYLNGEMENKNGKIKTGVMIVLEIGGIITTAVLGGTVGMPVIFVGIGILIFNHVWSAADAYMKAPQGPEVPMKGQAVTH